MKRTKIPTAFINSFLSYVLSHCIKIVSAEKLRTALPVLLFSFGSSSLFLARTSEITVGKISSAVSANLTAGAKNYYVVNQTSPYSIILTGKGIGDSSPDGASASVEWESLSISLKPAPNSAPVLDNSGSMTFTTITEDQTTNPGNTVTEIIASAGGDRITDPDAGALEGIAVTTLVSGNGSWQYSTNGGINWFAVGLVSNNLALLLRNTDLLRFVPDALNADSPSITFRAWDQTSGTAGTKVDASINGGITAFSTGTESASITVTAVNDAPSLAVGVALPAINEDDYNNLGFLVSSIANFATDVDAGALRGLAIPNVDNTNGTWQYTLNGTTWFPIGNVSTSSARLLPSNATARIRFVPNPDWYGTTGMFYYLAWDQTSGTGGGLADVTVRGGTTAFSSGISGSVQIVNSVNDAPVITSNGGSETASISINENILGVTTVIATDVDIPAQTLTFSISGGADAARFTVNSTSGVLTFISAPDFENPIDIGLDNIYNLTVQVSDGSLTDTQALSVTINNISNILIVTTSSDISDGNMTSIEALNANKGADGFISLREAITAANNTAGYDNITFGIPGTGVHTITPSAALPAINEAVIIDATTDDSFAANNNRPAIILNGNNIAADGLVLSGNADGCTIRGFVIRDFGGDGIEIQSGSDNNKIAGNYIGPLNTSGTDAGAWEANSGFGLNIMGSNNTIGGTTAADRNVISGNSDNGIYIGNSASNNIVIGNYIGTTVTGNVVLGNKSEGIEINGASGTRIGGTVTGAGNVVAASSEEGIWVLNGATGTKIQGNWIGTDITGTVNLGNVHGGIRIGNTGNPSNGNLIGGTGTGEGNVIAYNQQAGIAVDRTTNGASVNNAIIGNSIYSNTGIGIDLDDQYSSLPSDGVTLNDTGDPDTGGNSRQNFPVLSSVTSNGGKTSIMGSLNSTASTKFRIEFFSSPAGDPTGYGEGKTLIGSTLATTDISGNAVINVIFNGITVPTGYVVSATATVDLGNGNYGNTSEFSADAGIYAVANDNPCSATDLQVNQSCSFAIFSNLNATDSGIPLSECNGYSGGDIWFKVQIPASGNVIIKTESEAIHHYPGNNGWAHRLGLAVYHGTCPDLVYDTCWIESEGPGIPVNPEMILKGYSPGVILYLRVWEYNNDDNGQFRICAFTDAVNPTIICPGNINSQTDPGSCRSSVTIPLPVTEDNYGIKSVLNDYNGTNNATDDYPVGTTTVTWTVTDLVGHTTICTHNITIADNQDPEINCMQDKTEYLDNKCEFIIPDYKSSVNVSDNCDPSPSVSQSPAAGTILTGEGTIQEVTLFATDKNGNTGRCVFNILLHDNTPPLVSCKSDTTITLGKGIYKTEVILSPPQVSDNCGIQSVINNFNGRENATGIYSVGTTVVNYTVTDVNGNSSQCSQNITIMASEEFPFGLVIPQGFSPNDDGLNDKFEILGLEAYPENELFVYNIWDYEVYYMSGYNNSWDGTASKGLSSGKKLPTGTYFYILKLGKEQLIKGFVYLLNNN